MANYIRPVIKITKERAEGVYMSSGITANATPGCDSQYTGGVYHAPHFGWDNPMIEHYGCLGCPAVTGTACGLTTHYIAANYALSYDNDNGNRMPEWERRGYSADTIVDSTTHY